MQIKIYDVLAKTYHRLFLISSLNASSDRTWSPLLLTESRVSFGLYQDKEIVEFISVGTDFSQASPSKTTIILINI